MFSHDIPRDSRLVLSRDDRQSSRHAYPRSILGTVSRVRGEVFICPVAPVPSDGSMINPETGHFWASWQDEEVDGVLEDVELDGAEAAIEWGRERSETVYIRLGHRGDTYFSAGAVLAADDDGPMPAWPPTGAPPGGWWVPPVPPTLADVRAVVTEVAEGKRSAEDAAAWALDRMGPAIEAGGDQAIVALLGELSSGWLSAGGRVRPWPDLSPE